MRPWWVQRPDGERISPWGVCQDDISTGRSFCAVRRRSSKGERATIVRLDILAKSWLGSTMTCLLSFWPVSKSGRRDSGSAFMVFPGLWIS